MNFENEEDQEKFKSAWTHIGKGITREASQKVVDYLTTEIKEKESEINRVRASTIRKIGFSTEDSASARRNLDREIMKLNEENTQDLDNFRSQLTSTQCLPATATSKQDSGTRRTWSQPRRRFENKGYGSGRYNKPHHRPY